MLAVSVQPTPFKCILNVVPAGPRPASSANALGAIQCSAVFFTLPVSIHRPCDPPRSSGVLNWNSTCPAAFAFVSATTLDDSSQPPPPAATRLPVTVVQLS